MKNGPTILLLVLLVLGGWWYVRSAQSDAVARVRLQASNDSLDSALQRLASRDAARAQRDSALAHRNVIIQVRVDTLVLRSTVAESIFVQTLPDSLVAPFRAVITLKDSTIAGLRVIVGNQAIQLTLKDTSLVECRATLAESLKQRDGWRRQAHPPLFRRLLTASPPLVLGLLVGRLLR